MLLITDATQVQKLNHEVSYLLLSILLTGYLDHPSCKDPWYQKQI